MPYHNPYYGKTFFAFLIELFFRLFQFLQGNLKYQDLASDEVQIIVLVGVSASCALVGSFLVLKKMTMLANSLSHTILIGIVIAFAVMQSFGGSQHEHTSFIDVNTMLVASLAMGIITGFLTEFLAKFAKLQEDASTGLVFTSLFAIGIMLVTVLTKNVHIGLEVVMGNVDALSPGDFKLVYAVLALNAAVLFLFYKEYKIIAFDPALAKALGYSILFFNYLLMVLVSTTAIGAFRSVGVLMVLSFITGPALTARLLTHRLASMIFLAIFIGSLASLTGVALSRHFLSVYGWSLSTGGITVCVITAFFALASFKRLFYDKRLAAA